jgi:hypothetical protein
MYSKHEEDEIIRGIDEILYNLRRVPTVDVAYFLAKEEPKIAQELFSNLKNTLKVK